MTPEGHNELMPLIIRHLKAAEEPLDCNQLFDMPDIREVAPSTNRVSDYLGLLFRQGQVSRLPGASTGRARWRYVWREKVTPEWRKKQKGEVKNFAPKALLDRPSIYIMEDGDYINIELPNTTITIKTKK